MIAAHKYVLVFILIMCDQSSMLLGKAGSKLKVVLFDMTGTTVRDTVYKPDSRELVKLPVFAYQQAFEAGGIKMRFSELNECRGRDKKEVLEEKIRKYRQDLSQEEQLALAQRLHDVFITSILENLDSVGEMPGASEVFRYLKSHRIFVAVGSGFPQVVSEAISDILGWRRKGLVDYVTSGESAGAGRPKPNMINDVLVAASYLPRGIDLSKPVERFDYSILLKVGDTVSDMEEALNVGAHAVAVLTGTQSRGKLKGIVGKERTILTIRELPHYLERKRFF